MPHVAADNRYQNMTYNRTGKSGLLLPAISLGLWHNFGGIDEYENSREMVLRAFDLGITHFDLANNYGPPPGSAEQTFGQILKHDIANYRDEMIISTKAGYTMWPGPYGDHGSKKYLTASLDQSLKRMGLEYVDIFYSHRFDPDTPLEETMQALDLIVKQGKALYVGISNYPTEQTEEAVNILNKLGTKCLIHQAKYSMLNRWIEDGLTDVLEDKGIGCIAFCPLAQGMLTNKYLGGIPEGSRAAKKDGFLSRQDITDEIIAKVTQLNNIAQSRNQSLAQMSLAWVLNNKTVTSALIGASSVKQLEENVATLDNLNFSTSELTKIENILTSK